MTLGCDRPRRGRCLVERPAGAEGALSGGDSSMGKIKHKSLGTGGGEASG